MSRCDAVNKAWNVYFQWRFQITTANRHRRLDNQIINAEGIRERLTVEVSVRPQIQEQQEERGVCHDISEEVPQPLPDLAST